MTSEVTVKQRLVPPLALGRPRWTNLIMVASLVIFWAGVILKILS
jgi:hypothetical protein